MKRFTMSIALVAFVAALAAPLAFAQGSTAPATTPAEKAMKVTVAEKNTATAEKAEKKAEKAEKAVKAAPIKIDINSATKEELMTLPGVGDATAEKIIAGRPYKTKGALAANKIVGPKAYAKIRARIIARQEAK